MLNQVIDFCETWYECYSTGGHSNAIFISFVLKGKGKGNVHPRTGLEGPEGE
jgi:hypothetical protein